MKKKPTIANCKHKSDTKYIFKTTTGVTFFICEECYNFLFGEMFKQFLLEHRTQTLVNTLYQEQIDSLKEKIKK